MEPHEIRNLLDQIALAKHKLFESKIIRSERLTGEIGEYLAELQYPAARRAGTTSNKGWDLILPCGQKIQVKTHAKGAGNNARWTEVRHLEAFDILLIVVLTPNYLLRELYEVTRDKLKTLAKVNARNVATISWDKLEKLTPTKEVKKCFSSAGHKSRTPPEAEAPDPGEEANGDEAWELLTGVGCNDIYFAPRLWRTWNVTANTPGVFATRRKLVFEYITPNSSKTSVRNKISLRGLLPAGLGATVHKNLKKAVTRADWKPPKAGNAVQTQSCAKWTVEAKLAHHRAPPYPQKGFPSEQAFYDWLAGWDKLIGREQNAANTRLWEFIESVGH
jgi:hypothetical protein